MRPRVSDERRWKIAHVIASNFYGGPEKQIVVHLKRLDTSVYSGMLVSFLENGRDSEILDRARLAGIAHQGIRMASPLDIKAWRNLKRIVRDEAVDLLCVHGYKSTVMGAWIHKTLSVPTLAFSRGYTAENAKVAFYEFLDRLALRLVSGVVCVSEGQRRRLEALGVRARHVWVVHNAVSTPASVHDLQTARRSVLKRFELPVDSLLCVSAGRLSPEKGHKDLLGAIAAMGEQAFGCSFLLCGDGPCRNALERQAHALGIWERVRFAGFISDIQDVFQVMDLLVLPSHSEGLPNVVLEAFACGKAVVATSVGGVPELVENGRSGILVPPGQPGVLAEAIVRCITEPSLREAYGRAGQSTVRSQFTFEEQTRRLESIYAQILDAKCPRQ
jgi:glycosyltransferase involved in cell wall biosynthesis